MERILSDYYQCLREQKLLNRRLQKLRTSINAITPSLYERNLVKCKYADTFEEFDLFVTGDDLVMMETTGGLKRANSIPIPIEEFAAEAKLVCIISDFGSFYEHICVYKDEYWKLDGADFTPSTWILYPLSKISDRLKFLDNDNHSHKFQRHVAAKRIQRCVRKWFWKPIYRSGRIGLEAKRGMTCCNIELPNEM